MAQPTTAPDPRAFDRLIDWFRAALAATGDNPTHIALQIGLTQNTLREWLAHPDRKPKAPTVDGLARYFGVDQVELRALLAIMGKHPRRVAGGQKSVETRGRENVLTNIATVHASMSTSRSPQLYVQGAVARRRRTSDEWRQMQRAAAALHPQEKVVCVYCGDPTDLIGRTPSQARKGFKQLHDRCRIKIQRSIEVRTIMALLQRARGGPAVLQQRLKEQADAVRRRVKSQAKPSRGRKPTLIERDVILAIDAAHLADDEHISTRSIAIRWGWSLEREASDTNTRSPAGERVHQSWLAHSTSRRSRKYVDSRGQAGTHETIEYLIMLGRLIRRGPLPSGSKTDDYTGKNSTP